MLRKLLQWFHRPAAQATELLPFESLREIYERRFAGSDRERFRNLWCTLSSLCGVPPMSLHEADVLAELCPRRSKWSNINDRMDDLEDFAERESQGRELSTNIATVGALMDWLLTPLPQTSSRNN